MSSSSSSSSTTLNNEDQIDASEDADSPSTHLNDDDGAVKNAEYDQDNYESSSSSTSSEEDEDVSDSDETESSNIPYEIEIPVTPSKATSIRRKWSSSTDAAAESSILSSKKVYNDSIRSTDTAATASTSRISTATTTTLAKSAREYNLLLDTLRCRNRYDIHAGFSQCHALQQRQRLQQRKQGHDTMVSTTRSSTSSPAIVKKQNTFLSLLLGTNRGIESIALNETNESASYGDIDLNELNRLHKLQHQKLSVATTANTTVADSTTIDVSSAIKSRKALSMMMNQQHQQVSELTMS